MKRLAACAAGLLLGLTPDAAIAQREQAPVSAFAARKAEILLREQLPCLGCHQLNGEGGRVGPDLSTVRQRRSPEYIAAMIDDPQRVVPGSAMPRTPMSDATRALITRYLGSLPGAAPTGELPLQALGTPSPAATVAAGDGVASSRPDGARLYARWCASCHGARGEGNGPNAPHLPVPPANHTDKARESERPDDSLYDTIAGGGAIMSRSPRMPAFGATLSDEEIRALVTHIRALCRCQGPAWSRDGERVRRR
jgi:mono/diheme cytochrome c family protein